MSLHAPPSPSRWPDLPPDVLREISRRLRDAADLVRFHAVCKPWRDSHSRDANPTKQQSLLPWLLAPDKMKIYSIYLNLRCVFSRTSYWARPPFAVLPRDWVASADGTAVWYISARPSPCLRDPLTAAVALLLPPFPHKNDRWKGVVYRDSTVLLYAVSDIHGGTSTLRVMLLRPGDTAWTVVRRTIGANGLGDFYVAYHRGKILITMDKPFLINYNNHVNLYVLESGGELLCVSVHVRPGLGGKRSVPSLIRALSVVVHTLEEDVLAPGKMQWVRRDGRSLADRVLFLGWPNSFAVDASRLSGDDAVSSGCAYFTYHDPDTMSKGPGYVFRYNLVDDKAKFVEQLPHGWDGNKFTWLFPQPCIAPIQEITESLKGRKWWNNKKKLHMIPTRPRSKLYIERPRPQCYNPYIRVLVRNLPRRVDSFQLQQFFSKHGKVSNAKVMHNRKKKMSKKIGLVTIAMVEEQENALASLNGLVFNGCIVEVTLVRRWKGRRMHPAGSNQKSRGSLIFFGLLLLLFLINIVEAFLIWKIALMQNNITYGPKT